LGPVYVQGGHRCQECWLPLLYLTTAICHFQADDMTRVWVGQVNVINELCGSGNRELPDIIMNLKLGHSYLLFCCWPDSGIFCGCPHSKRPHFTGMLCLSTHVNFHKKN